MLYQYTFYTIIVNATVYNEVHEDMFFFLEQFAGLRNKIKRIAKEVTVKRIFF